MTLIERGWELSSNVLSWGHVTLFSPNRLNFSKLGREIVVEAGASLPGEEEYPTGREYVEKYLKYLTDFLISVISLSLSAPLILVTVYL